MTCITQVTRRGYVPTEELCRRSSISMGVKFNNKEVSYVGERMARVGSVLHTIYLLAKR